MTEKTIKNFINEIYSEGRTEIYATNKTVVYHIDDVWGLRKLDLKDYATENNRGYRYVSVILDIFSNLGRTVPLENKKARTIKDSDSFEIILISSKRKPI